MRIYRFTASAPPLRGMSAEPNVICGLASRASQHPSLTLLGAAHGAMENENSAS